MEGLPRSSREAIKLEGFALLAANVVEKSAELGAAQLRAGVGDGLDELFDVELRGDGLTGAVVQLQDPGFIPEHLLGVLPFRNVAGYLGSANDSAAGVVDGRDRE